MSKKFRESHLIKILHGFSKQTLPLDVFLRNYFKSEKAIGSHDRKFLAETVYTMFRWLGLVDYLSVDHSWESRFEIFNKLDILKERLNPNIPAHISVSFPKSMYDFLISSLGKEKTDQFCLASNSQAPTTIRVNPLKISRDELYKKWQDTFEITKCLHSELGIIFKKRENFFGMSEFKEGLFEVQDEGSQLVSFLVDAKPGDQVLDFCSGSGGKTLGFAYKLESKGQIYLHDIRDFVLGEAKKRLKRAGIQNAQILKFSDTKKKKLKKTMDWVLVDAPCSGSGTLRRNPDMKWRFNPSSVNNLQQEQREIFAEGLSYLKPGGKIVYATCSILPQENEQQTEYFLSKFPLKLFQPPLQTFPSDGGMDGFYAAVFQLMN
ncbi:MAG: RsmB/NOP family class I SAM-dependent RNA methyltransferase [Chlamydiae bacterium]|nr:RsmB/NOP family class I SAM-dependent RNA methyltransferase [Chlamydiota bacterium]